MASENATFTLHNEVYEQRTAVFFPLSFVNWQAATDDYFGSWDSELKQLHRMEK